MTSELRPAALVAHEVCEEMEEYGPTFAERVIKADREAVAAYWYRQGKDDGWQMARKLVDRLREELAEAYIKLSGKSTHTSDCATSNAPAMDPGPCNCDAPENSHD